MTFPVYAQEQDNARELRALPHDFDAEQALLGALLYDNGAFDRVSYVREDQFYEPFHGRLFDAMSLAIGRGQLAEPLGLQERFKSDPSFVQLGGLAYLADLVDRAPPAAAAPEYARLVADLADKREIIRIAAEATVAASDGQHEAKDILEGTEAQLYALAERKGSDRPIISFSDALAGAVRMTADAFERDGALSGLSTGLIDLDRKLGGLHPSDLLIIAGRPSMGKTALATNIAFHVARHYAFAPQPDGSRKTIAGGRVLFFSLEMSAEQLAMRIVAQVAGISSDRLRKGEINASEFGRVRDAAIEVQEAPLFIDDTGAISIAKMTARARRQQRQRGLDLIVVDYLQLATVSNQRHSSNRVSDVSEITAALKAMAKDLNVPVLALSQLSRNVENREDKRPQLSDLRESGSIEQDADAVMFVFREAYYLARTEPKDGTAEHLAWQEQMEQAAHVAELIIGKQRHGPIGTVRLSFNEDLTLFGNLARDSRQGSVNYGYRDD